MKKRWLAFWLLRYAFCSFIINGRLQEWNKSEYRVELTHNISVLFQKNLSQITDRL
jgi:hypothetical protein